jgi:hypothetical protein
MTSAKFRLSGFCCLVLGLDGSRTRRNRSFLYLRAGGTMERKPHTGARSWPPGNPSAWPIRARSGILHASWDVRIRCSRRLAPGLALASAEMMEKAMDDGFPIVVPVRKDATPEQISQVFEGVRALVERLGLAAAQAENP